LILFWQGSVKWCAVRERPLGIYLFE
jgi:hypothetical protein